MHSIIIVINQRMLAHDENDMTFASIEELTPMTRKKLTEKLEGEIHVQFGFFDYHALDRVACSVLNVFVYYHMLCRVVSCCVVSCQVQNNQESLLHLEVCCVPGANRGRGVHRPAAQAATVTSRPSRCRHVTTRHVTSRHSTRHRFIHPMSFTSNTLMHSTYLSMHAYIFHAHHH